MRVSKARFTVLLIVALTTLGVPGGAAARTQTANAQLSDTKVAPKDGRTGTVRGTTVDRSAGVLPGVTVSAVAVDGRTLDTTVTDGTGEFRFDRLPAGSVSLSFHLDGFEDARTNVTIPAPGPGSSAAEVRLVQRLELLTRTESVIVRADPPPPPPPPKPVLVPVPEHDPASVCGPAKAEGAVPSFGTILSRRTETTQALFSPGDELLIDGGTANGLAVGQNFVVRRRYPTAETTARTASVFSFSEHGRTLPVFGEHSSGLLQIVAVDEQESTAVVVYACDEMMTGDYLAAFEPEPMQAPEPAGKPAFEMAARILFADAGQMLGVPRRMMVIDRGTRDGVRAGQRFTLIRRSGSGRTKPVIVGEAVVVAARTDSATIRVEQATDVIFFGQDGDLAAPQRPSQRASTGSESR